MAETTTKLNLYQKLLKITEEVGMIEKTGKNTQQGYAFTEWSQVAAEVRANLAKWGVMIFPETTERSMAQVSNKNGTVFTQATVKSKFTIVNADNPEERMVCEWDGGEALDTSDKATNKAVTASTKTFYMKLFNISDKEDPDQDSHQLDQLSSVPNLPERDVKADIAITKETQAKVMSLMKTKANLKGTKEQVFEAVNSLAATLRDVPDFTKLTEPEGQRLSTMISNLKPGEVEMLIPEAAVEAS